MNRCLGWAVADSVVADSVVAESVMVDSLVILIGHVRSVKGHQ